MAFTFRSDWLIQLTSVVLLVVYCEAAFDCKCSEIYSPSEVLKTRDYKVVTDTFKFFNAQDPLNKCNLPFMFNVTYLPADSGLERPVQMTYDNLRLLPYLITCSHSMSSKSSLKENADSDLSYILIHMGNDGNTFYKAIALALYGDATWTQEVRNIVSIYLKGHFEKMQEEGLIGLDTSLPFNKDIYVRDVRSNDTYATKIEIIAAARAFKTSIYIYSYGSCRRDIIECNTDLSVQVNYPAHTVGLFQVDEYTYDLLAPLK